MCWKTKIYNICYECNVEWNHKDITTPCWYQEQASRTGKPCTRITQREDAPVNYENCETCKVCRKAEEVVQQKIHRLKPLHLATVNGERVVVEDIW